MNFLWNAKYQLGIPAIDEQHKPIIDVLNEIHKPADVVGFDVFSRKLQAFVDQHLAYEEGLMRQHAYPGYALHLAQHDRFRHMVAAFVHRTDTSAITTGRMVALRWFIDHITGAEMDRKLGAYLVGRGVV